MSILNVIQPLVVNPILACIIGLNETIVLQQINYWLTINSRANKGQYEGKTWTYSSLDQWRNNNFPFWSTKTIQRTLTSLKNKNLILSIENPTNKMDRRLWYTINEEGLKNLEIEYAKKEKEYLQSEEEKNANMDKNNPQPIENSDMDKMSSSSRTECPLDMDKLSTSYGQNVHPHMDKLSLCTYKRDYNETILRDYNILGENENSQSEKLLIDEIQKFTRNEELTTVLKLYLKTRIRLKSPLDLEQLKLLLKKLNELSKYTDEQIEIVKQSIMGGYKSFFKVGNTTSSSKLDNYFMTTERQTDGYSNSELKEMLGIRSHL